ncbi:MAG: DUF218 domain-containing protein [Anaerolineae bacterium]|nr:DUF218 domain-containing protein [Anaerolineae bacterium]
MLLNKVLLVIFITGLGILFLPSLISYLVTLPKIHTIENSGSSRAAIVFGAGLYRDGSPTPVLRDRVSAAAELYFSGQVEKLLMSGDNSYMNYNEPGAMKAYALELGVPEEAIVLDYAGRRTYDTCFRAKEIFGLDEAILVTQRFHLPRAIVTCNLLGLNAQGVVADKREYHPRTQTFWQVREIPATLVAFWDILFRKPLPVLGDPEPIFTDHHPAS